MLQNLIVGYASRRGIFKLVATLTGTLILVIGVVGKVSEAGNFLWIASPLLLLGLAEAGLAAEQRRCLELLKGNADVSALSEDPLAKCIARFISSVCSLSIWPFYLLLFGVVAFGGGSIARVNKEAAAKAASAVPATQTFIQQPNGMITLPVIPQRTPNAINLSNRIPFTPPVRQATPPVIIAPPRSAMTPRAQIVPGLSPAPVSTPNNSPNPAAKSP